MKGDYSLYTGNMEYYYQPSPFHYEPRMMELPSLLKTLQNCEATCEQMITHLLSIQDSNRSKQIELLRDCADICGLAAKYVDRKSAIAKHCAKMCAMIFQTCGNECSKFSDQESQMCAQHCLNCAKECQMLAMS